jgi:hypothetical protein
MCHCTWQRMCTRMHFRQRVAWLLLAAYLLLSAGTLYYIFEISARFSLFALDHAEKEHSIIAVDGSLLRQATDATTTSTTSTNLLSAIASFLQSLLSHVSDIPPSVLAILLLTGYIQVFCMLWMCTRPEANCFTSCLWPVCLYTALTSARSSSRTHQQHGSLSLFAGSNGFQTVTTYDL